MRDTKRQEKRIGAVLLCLTGALLLWHCRLSFCQSDESFYLALVHRFWRGDRMILDEWNACQIYSPILLPFYALYRLIVPEGTGVYLYARIVYVLFSTIISVLFYQRCCKSTSSRFQPLIAAILPLLYSRANICGPSYYNLCAQFIIASALLLWKDENNDPLHKPVLAGFFLALTVLCNPVLGIFVFCGLIIICLNRNTRKLFWSVFTGAFLTALVYMIYLVHFGTPTMLLKGSLQLLKNATTADSLMIKLRQNGNILLQYVSIYVFPMATFGSLTSLWYWKQGKQPDIIVKTLYLLLCLILIGYTASKSISSICFVITVPFTILIFPIVIKALLFRINDFALIIYVFGVVLAIAFFVASNTGADAMTTGTCLSSAGGVLLLFDKGKDENVNFVNKTSIIFERVVCICICLLLIGVFSAHRFLGIYRDAPVSQLTHRIENGPAAGLFTSDAHADEYETIMKEIIKLHEEYPDARVLFSRNLPWAYLASDWICADFTVWSTLLSDPRIEKYYQTHQEPDLVFIFDESVAGYETAPFNNHLQFNTFNRNVLDGTFYDHLVETYQIIDTNEILTVYCRSGL